MTPYQGLFFFCVLGLLLTPAAVLGLLEKPLRLYGLAFTVAMLVLVFGYNGQLLALAAFFVWQAGLCLIFRLIPKNKVTLYSAILLALLPLALVKLVVLQLLGISYMTFRAVGILLDIYDGRLKALSLLDYCYFLLFFPAVASGPIDRFRRFSGDLERRLNRAEYLDMLGRGVFKLVFGAFSAIVVSNFIWSILPSSLLLYMYGYTFYLFFNFAGYSSMAIGTAYILGVSLPENFNMPFLSLDMKDFWSRWHISLSSWLRDNLYTRFVAGSIKAKRFKNPRAASYIGYVLTMLAMGAWHGLTPGYLAYGAYHAALMCLNEALDLHCKPFKKLKRHPWGQVCLAVITFHLFSFGLLIFSGRII
jgi:membrane protein involved in D-alanine export